jgi:hypothetical protein
LEIQEALFVPIALQRQWETVWAVRRRVVSGPHGCQPLRRLAMAATLM